MAWFSFGTDDLSDQLRDIKTTLNRMETHLMATNDELNNINAALTEAGTEIPAKLDELLAQVGDAADPALVADIKARAQALADIVPNEPPPEEPPA